MKKFYEIHVISHTHWDREWYLTFQQFRLKLVELVDELLKILETNPEFTHFNFDGQTIVLEDYLEIKPHNKERLKQYIHEGKIAVGPWYILPDEFLVSAEATIRNLILGHRLAAEFGKVMKIGYIPDPFGHISQMPQILRGFGIDNIILWRGFGGEPDQTRSEYYWDAPDGSRVLFVHLPNVGYSETLHFPKQTEQAAAVITRLKEAYQQRAATPYLSIFTGSDHIKPQADLPQILKQVNAQLDDVVVIQSSLTDYIAKLRESVPDDLQVVRGEFRGGQKHTYLLTGVLSTRMYLKQANEKAQTLLEKWAEPFATITWMLDVKKPGFCQKPDFSTYPREFLWQSWKYLLQNHPHDSMCGCSLDAVHEQMMTRFAWSEEIAEELTQNSLNTIAAQIDTSDTPPTVQHIVIYNPLGWTRDEVAHVTIDFLTPKQTPSVEFLPYVPKSPYTEEVKGFILQDEQGHEIPYQLIKRQKCQKVLPSPDMTTFPILLNVIRFEILLYAKKVPACGYSTYQVIPHKTLKTYPAEVQQLPCGMENEYLRVSIQPNGSLVITDKSTGKVYPDCHVFEDSGDVGDEYNYSYPLRDRIVSSIGLPANIELIEQGPLRITCKVSQRLSVPKCAEPDRQSRSQETVKISISACISLSAGAKRVDITTKIENTARDHRLRVLFPSGIHTDSSYAEGQFAVVQRPIRLPDDPNEYQIEKPLPTHPQQAFVDVNDGEVGLTVINKGLPEYEVKDDACRTIALTLLRSVDQISRGDLLTRPGGNAGWPYKAPDGQCLGTHTFRYALAPHRGTWQTGLVHREAHQHNVPCRVVQTDSHQGHLSQKMSFIEISPASLIISAIKKAETRDALILRCYNASDEATTGEIRVFRKIRQAALTNLHEEIVEMLTPHSDYTIALQVRPWEVKTLNLEF